MARSKKSKVETEAAETPAELKPGYIVDFISGLPVKDAPEERDAVQVFARRLVEDYGYPKELIQTRPQYRVRIRPSDEEKSYPVDIAVFRTPKKLEDDLFMVVECKKKTRKDGVAQLKLYLDMSAAEVGVWFNGDEHQYLRKILHKNGSRTYEPLPNIPRCGQRIEDIGLYKRKDLKKPSNLKAVFRDLRNHLAGMTTGITRDEALAQEIINILFCKILDEQETAMDETVSFRAGVNESAQAIKDRVLAIFERVKTATFEDVFSDNEAIKLDAESLRYVVGELQNYSVMASDRDAIGEAFEVFIGPALRGSEGQFFTPRNVVNMVVGMLNPQPGDRIIDPACGSGGFLIGALDHVWGRLRADAKRKGWPDRQLWKREVEVATDCFRGVDKDAFLAKVTKAYMALVGDGRGGIFCANSLQPPNEWSAQMQDKVTLGQFDFVMTNPPFGKDIVVKGTSTLSQYGLGYKWKRNRETKCVEKTTELHEQHAPQLLFLERSLQLLKPGGKLGIVLPESLLGNPSYEHLSVFLKQHCTVEAVVTLPEALFKTSGKGGTHTKVCVLIIRNERSTKPYRIFMAEAKWCGHDSRGNPTLRRDTSGEWVLLDDVPTILERYRLLLGGAKADASHFGFFLRSDQVVNNILVPKYYAPEITLEQERMAKTHEFVAIQKLMDDGILSVDTGIEIGKMAYGTGKIPFIRTSDLSNWEIKADFKHGVSEAIHEELRDKVDVQAGDILLVRDGTYLIGTSAIVTESDLPMLFQSHLYRLRVLKQDRLNPWLLFASLNSPMVKRQIKAKQFTQDIIDTLGRRLFEIMLPLPKDKKLRAQIAKQTQRIIETRIDLRNQAKAVALAVEGLSEMDEWSEIVDD